MFSASTKKRRAFVMAYVLARQDTGCKLSAAKTMTALNALFRVVFSRKPPDLAHRQMSYLRS
jgi:hypothetical protein